MIRENRAVPILLVLTIAFVLYLGGCFGTEEASTATEATPPPIASPTPAPVVDSDIDIAASDEEPFYYTVESGDRIDTIATKFNVTRDVIIRANPQMDADLIITGEQLLIPGAGTDAEVLEDLGPDRADGITVNYVIESGDTFGEIANTWTVSVEALAEANPEVDPNNLQVNNLLVIPPWGTGIDPANLRARTTPVPVVRQPNEILEHTVAAGDFLSALAELYGVTTQQIVDANGLPNGGNDIQIGDVLLIPPPESVP